MQLSQKNSRIEQKYEKPKKDNNNTFSNTIGTFTCLFLYLIPQLQ